MPTPELKKKRRLQYIQAGRSERRFPWAKLKTYPVLPLRTYDKFDVDPMFVIANAFSKLRKIGEGAALQIVFGQAESSYGKKIKKTAEEIRKGKNF